MITDPQITMWNQGWQCPKCGRGYSPTTAMCFYCQLALKDFRDYSSSPKDKMEVLR